MECGASFHANPRASWGKQERIRSRLHSLTTLHTAGSSHSYLKTALENCSFWDTVTRLDGNPSTSITSYHQKKKLDRLYKESCKQRARPVCRVRQKRFPYESLVADCAPKKLRLVLIFFLQASLRFFGVVKQISAKIFRILSSQILKKRKKKLINEEKLKAYRYLFHANILIVKKNRSKVASSSLRVLFIKYLHPARQHCHVMSI